MNRSSSKLHLRRRRAARARAAAGPALALPVISEVFYDARGKRRRALLRRALRDAGHVARRARRRGRQRRQRRGRSEPRALGSDSRERDLRGRGRHGRRREPRSPAPICCSTSTSRTDPTASCCAPESSVLDALGYGVFAVGEVFAGEGAPAVDPAAGASLARRFADVDTGDNAADFIALAAPTPGSAPLSAVPEPGERHAARGGPRRARGRARPAAAPLGLRLPATGSNPPSVNRRPGPRRAARHVGVPLRPGSACAGAWLRPLACPTGNRSGDSGFRAGRPILRAHGPVRRHRDRLSGGLDKACAEGETRAAASGVRGTHRQHDHRVQHQRPPRRPAVPRADRGQREGVSARDQPRLLRRHDPRVGEARVRGSARLGRPHGSRARPDGRPAQGDGCAPEAGRARCRDRRAAHGSGEDTGSGVSDAPRGGPGAGPRRPRPRRAPAASAPPPGAPSARASSRRSRSTR